MTVHMDLVTLLSKEEYIDWLDNRLSTRPVAVFANSFEAADQFVFSQSREHRIAAGRKLVCVRRPMWRHRLRDDLRFNAAKSSGLEDRAHACAIGQEFLEHRASARKELHIRVRRNLFTCPGPDHDIPIGAQHSATLPCSPLGISEMVKTHRHEDHVDGSVHQRNRFSSAALVVNAVPLPLPTGSIQHLLRGIDTYDTDTKSSRQAFREAPGPAAQVEDRADGPTIHLRLDYAHPKVDNLGTMIAPAIVGGWNTGQVVVHPLLPRTLAIAVIVFQFRVVTGTPKSRSKVPR